MERGRDASSSSPPVAPGDECRRQGAPQGGAGIPACAGVMQARTGRNACPTFLPHSHTLTHTAPLRKISRPLLHAPPRAPLRPTDYRVRRRGILLRRGYSMIEPPSASRRRSASGSTSATASRLAARRDCTAAPPPVSLHAPSLRLGGDAVTPPVGSPVPSGPAEPSVPRAGSRAHSKSPAHKESRTERCH